MSDAREVRMVACVSLDGFIARDDRSAPNQEDKGGWTSPEDKREFWREVKAADVIIGGRATLETMPATGKPMALVTRDDSMPLLTDSSADVEWYLPPYVTELHQFLARHTGERLLLCGGSMTYDLFLRWNLVDHVVLVVEPVMLRDGVRLRTPPATMEGQKENKFVLLKCTPLNARGTVRLDYRRPKP